jgi:uncharacterized protein involved in exopolysaccharide biosynthesis
VLQVDTATVLCEQEYWRVLLRRWRLLVLTSAGLGFLALGVYPLLPKVYRSTASIIVPQESGGPSVLSALTDSALSQAASALTANSLTPHSDLFLSILKSETMARETADRFRFRDRYDLSFGSKAVQRVKAMTNVSVSREGAIVLSVEDSDAKLAADVANFYVENLDRMLSRFATTEASKQKGFISARLSETERELRAAEEALLRFQQSHKAISLPDQTKGAVEAVAQLRGEILAAEVKLQVLRNEATELNPEVIRLRSAIDERRRQLAELRFGKGGLGQPPIAAPGRQDSEPVLIVFSEVPELALEQARLLRNLKTQETVFALLTQQLEQAKIAEARDTPLVQVLDQAIPADLACRPVATLLAFAAGAFGLLASSLGVLASNSRRRVGGASTTKASFAAASETVSPQNTLVPAPVGKGFHRKKREPEFTR